MSRGWCLGVVNGFGLLLALEIVPHCARRVWWMPLVGLAIGMVIGMLEDAKNRQIMTRMAVRIVGWAIRPPSQVTLASGAGVPRRIAFVVHTPALIRSRIAVRLRPERASLMWQALAGLVVVSMVVVGAVSTLSTMHAASSDRAVATTSDLVHAVDVDVLAAQAYDPVVHAAAASGAAAWSVSAPVGAPITMTVSPNTTGVAVKASGSANVSIVGTLPTPLPTPN